MEYVPERFEKASTRMGLIARGALRTLWRIVQFPVGWLLALLEPVVALLLCGLAFLFVVMAFFWEFSAVGATFSFWRMIAFAVGCGVVLVIYHMLMRIFSPK